MQFFKRNTEGQFAKKQFKPLSKRGKQILGGFSIFCFCFALGGSIAKSEGFLDNTLHAVNMVSVAEAAEMPTPLSATDIMLQKIADCESGIRNADGSAVPGSARQRDANGRPIMNVNSTGSLDVGWAQINLDFHYDEIARMGLDVVSSEADNKAFARHLYKLHGKQPWSASRSCWNR